MGINSMDLFTVKIQKSVFIKPETNVKMFSYVLKLKCNMRLKIFVFMHQFYLSQCYINERDLTNEYSFIERN